jgi:iron-sulfur cluster assembly protein
MDLLEQTQTAQLNLTTSAAHAVEELLAKRDLEGYALRVFVSGGGCSGFQYGMALEDNIRETDLVTEQHGVKIVVDEISVNYLAGATDAVASCGCGSSFRTSEDPGHAHSSGGCSC